MHYDHKIKIELDHCKTLQNKAKNLSFSIENAKVSSQFSHLIKINMIFPLSRNKSIRSCNDCALDRNQTRTKKSKFNAHHQIFSVSWHRTKVTFLFALAMMNASTLLWAWPQMVEMHFPNCYFYYAAPAVPGVFHMSGRPGRKITACDPAAANGGSLPAHNVFFESIVFPFSICTLPAIRDVRNVFNSEE